MKRYVGGLVLAVVLAAGVSARAAEGQGVALFDGKSLEGWSFHLVDPKVKMADVWSVQDGVLVCKGEPLGYLVTKQSFKNFELTLQWRWTPGMKPGNSGVLLRISGAPIGFMPPCYEAQLKNGSAGDIWAFRGPHIGGPAERIRKVENHKELGTFPGTPKLKDLEKKPGEWNEYRITFVGGQLTVAVNGEVVNEATGCDVVAGPIGLQSEGGQIEFRNIRIVTK